MNPNQFMHQNQILDDVRRSSNTVHITIKNILILGNGVERLSEDQRLPELALTFGYPYGSSLFPIIIS